MARTQIAVAFLCAVTITSAGCDAEVEPAPRKLDEAGFADALVSAFCDSLATCCAMQSNKFNRAECEWSFRQKLPTRIAMSPSARFVPASAERCLDNVRTAVSTCSGIQLVPCDNAWVGTVALGEPCLEDGDCAEVPGQTKVCSFGVCKARSRAGLGDSCARTCLSDGNCYDFDETGLDLASPSVVSWGDCFAGDGRVCIEQTCQAAPPAGSPCFQGSVCGRDLVCNEQENLCEAPSERPCGSCEADSFCTETNSCETKRSLGSPCLRDDYCVSNLCEVETLSCVDSLTLGAAHGTDLECAGRTHF